MNDNPMTAKEYLSQAYRIDQRINAKLEQAERLRELSRRRTVAYGGERVTHSRNVHRMEDTVVRLIEAERALDREIDAFLDVKQEIRQTIALVADADCRLLLELRYLSMKRWEDIAGEMQMCRTSVYLLHRRALDMVETILRTREECANKLPQALPCLQMTEAGWSSDAETVAANLEAALNSALGIQSPSTRMKPTGSNVAAGVGAGMGEYDFTGEASSLAGRLSGAVSAAMPASLLRPAGLNAMRGLTAGINAGRSGVITAMRSAARAAVNAAKAELKINSPSKVFEDEVGVMTMRGWGRGVLKESKEQAKVIRNAARYLTGEAKAGSIMTTSNDNRRTYNQQSSISFAGSNFYINDRQDAYALAVEIASLTRRQQRGRGLRMA